jgi:hypothetical protein
LEEYENSEFFLKPAPCLTKLWVSRIRSEEGADEDPEPDQLVSKQGHAGSKWILWTSELGYGNNQIVKLNNKKLTKTRSIPITDSTGHVVGFQFEWNYSGPFISGGTLTFHDDSTNGPCHWPGQKSMDITFQILPLEPGSGS